MATIKKILAPVDLSDGSRAALDYALFFADTFDADINVLYVWDLPHYVRPDLMVWMEDQQEQPVSEVARVHALKELEQFLSALPPEQMRRISSRLEGGEAVEEIVRIANDEAFDLLVMGTHGRSGLSHLMMGSVAEKVVRRASCPVLTVHMPKS